MRAGSPRDAIRSGIAYLAEDRRDRLIMPLSVRENITLAAPEKVSRRTKKPSRLDPALRHWYVGTGGNE